MPATPPRVDAIRPLTVAGVVAARGIPVAAAQPTHLRQSPVARAVRLPGLTWADGAAYAQ